MIELGEWLPDVPDNAHNGVTVAKNGIPAARGYLSMKSLAALSNAGTANLNVIFAAQDPSGTNRLFAGDAGKLYLFNKGTNALDDVSKSGGYSLSTDDRWRFTQYGETLVAVGGHSTSSQAWTLGTSSAFADLGGSPPNAKFAAVIREHVVFGNIASYPYRIQWSEVGDPTGWTVGTNLSDFQDVGDLGPVTGLVGGEFGVALFQKGIVRVTFVGSPFTFQFDVAEGVRGCPYPGSVAALGPTQVFYYSESGFQMFNGQQSQAIGAERVDRWFDEALSVGNASKISCAIDPVNKIVAWSFPSVAGDGTPDTLLMFNYVVNRWAYASVSTNTLGSLYAPGYTLEDLNNVGTLDALPASLDSPIWAGGSFLFGGSFDNKIATFTGSELVGTFETADIETAPTRVSTVHRIYPHTRGGDVTVQLASKMRPQDTGSFSAASSMNSTGFCPTRSTGRFHRLRLNLSGAWSQAYGFDPDFKQTGMR